MSDIICTNCRGAITAGCYVCNPSVYAPMPAYGYCTHGQLAPFCLLCEYEQRIAALEAEVAELTARCFSLLAFAPDEITAGELRKLRDDMTAKLARGEAAEAEVAQLRSEHCKDCCCARSWAALGPVPQNGASIPEHIEALRERAEAADAKLRAVGELPRYAVDARYLHNSVDLHITPDERGRFIRAYDIDALLKEKSDE